MSKAQLARILIVSSLILSAGCVRGVLTPLVSMGHWAESAQEIREDRTQLLAEQRDLLQSERRALQAERVSETRAFIQGQKNCKGETVPEVESKIELPFRQQFRVGPPELDVEQMKERLRILDETHEREMEDWRRSMADWRSREQEHYREQSRQREQFRAPQQQCSCGNVHSCGCANAPNCGCPQLACCQQCQKGPTCATTPRGSQPFMEAPPRRPTQSLLVRDVPLKLELQLTSNLGETEIEKTRVRRVPVQQREQVKDYPCCNRCGKQSCDCAARANNSPQSSASDEAHPMPVSTDEAKPPVPILDTTKRLLDGGKPLMRLPTVPTVYFGN